jgi:hypothetical protein
MTMITTMITVMTTAIIIKRPTAAIMGIECPTLTSPLCRQLCLLILAPQHLATTLPLVKSYPPISATRG